MGREEEITLPIVGAVAAAEELQSRGRGAREATSVDALPAIIGGRYRVLRFIARGGMGSIFEVVHVSTGEHLALKLLRSRGLVSRDQLLRFQREARIHGLVKSEHVVRVVDADVAAELDGAPYLVMELLVGDDLEQVAETRRPSPIEIVSWMRQLGRALDRAHGEGIIHRDLKPENVFLAERSDLPPIVKILDFGVARIAAEGSVGTTVSGQILGTPRYMAPEQAAGELAVSSAVDRFALGLIAFRLLCGRHYYATESWVALLAEVARGPRARPSTLSARVGRAFDAWFARACARAPEARFATCREQIEALERALALAPSSASDGAAAVPVSPRSRRPPALTWQLAVAACTLAGLLAWGLGHAVVPASDHTPALVRADAIAVGAPAASTSPALRGEIPAMAEPESPPTRLDPPRGEPPASRRVGHVPPASPRTGKRSSALPGPTRDTIWDEP